MGAEPQRPTHPPQPNGNAAPAAPPAPSQPATAENGLRAVRNGKTAYSASASGLAILADYLERRARRPENLAAADAGAFYGLKAMALAPTLDICRALLAGERVPWQLLDGKNAWRYQIREGHRARDGRLGLDDFNDIPAPQ